MTLVRLVALSFSSSALAFLLELLLARKYGASPELDAYRLSHAVFIIGAQMLVYQWLPHITVPLFTRLRAQGGDAHAWRHFLSFHAILAAACVFAVIAVILAASPLAGLLAPGLSDPTSLVLLLPVMAASAALYLSAGAIAAALGIYGQFAVGMATPILVNIALLAGVLFMPPSQQLWVLGGGTLTGAAIACAIHIAVARRYYNGGEWLRPNLHLRNAGLWFGPLLIPIAIGLAFGHLGNVIVQRTLSGEGSGIIAMFSYAIRLTTIVYTPAALYGNTVFPSLADALARRQNTEFRSSLRHAVGMTLLLSLPVAALLWLTRLHVVSILFGSGKLDPDSLRAIADMLAWAILSAPAGAVSALLLKALAAANNRAGIVVPPIAGLAVLAAILPPLRTSRNAEGIAAAYALWIVSTTLLQFPFAMRVTASMRK